METKSCPVCGGGSRAPAADGMASVRKDAGINYLKHAAARLKMTPTQLAEAVQVVQCAACRTYYCDPWLDQETTSYIFTVGSPDHIAGWANFEHWLSSDAPNGMQAANRRLRDALGRRIGPIGSYAEYGCPFQGFLLEFGSQENPPARRMDAFSKAINRAADVRWTASARLHHAAAKLADTLSLTYQRFRILKESLKSPGAKPPASPAPSKRFLLTNDTARAWGNSCVRYGGSCKYYAGRVLGADVLPFHGARIAVDLLGIFNGLDHTDDPVGVLRHGLTLARHIVVSTHHASVAGKQHQYEFDESFPAWLASALKGARTEDITADVIGGGRRDDNYLLISRDGR